MAGRDAYRFDLGDVNNGMFTGYSQSRKPTRFYLLIVGGVPVPPVKPVSSTSTVPPARTVKPRAVVFLASTSSASVVTAVVSASAEAVPFLPVHTAFKTSVNHRSAATIADSVA
jgi:hypothetical protein